jgi:hypothetical protein
MCQQMIPGLVVSLNLIRRPPTVFWAVIATVVDAVDFKRVVVSIC